MFKLNKKNKMGMTYFIIWLVIGFSGLLIFPLDKRIKKMDDNSRLKKWWKKNVVDWDHNDGGLN
jgi:hypothetical protein